ADVSIYIYSITGDLIWKRSYTGGTAGGSVTYNTVAWDGKNDAGQMVANGMYVYIITATEDGSERILKRARLVVYR
ncbi:MAG: hypothetical protein V1843_03345, partial [bacterium]